MSVDTKKAATTERTLIMPDDELALDIFGTCPGVCVYEAVPNCSNKLLS